MKVEAPCRLGERFNCEKVTKKGRFYLTGMNFFLWNWPGHADMTLYGKHHADNEQEHTQFFDPKDPEEGVVVSFEIPDKMIVPGYPLRELGLETNAVGRLHGLVLTEDGWGYYISYGRTYGNPLELVRTPKLDKLFDPVLPLHAVQVNLRDFLV